VLVAAVLYPPFAAQKRSLVALESEVRKARLLAAQTQAISAQIAEIAGRIEFIESAKFGRPAAVVLIDEIARLLPDTTSLTRLELNADEIRLNGVSTSASALIGRLESSSLLQGARFLSPVTRDPRTGHERFNLTAKVVPAAPVAKASGTASLSATDSSGESR
jgi:general secretion pathway protein L